MFTPIGIVVLPAFAVLLTFVITWLTGSVSPGLPGLYQAAAVGVASFVVMGLLMIENSMMCKQLCCSRCFRMREDYLVFRVLSAFVQFITRLYSYFPGISMAFFYGRGIFGLFAIAWLTALCAGGAFWWSFFWIFVAGFSVLVLTNFSLTVRPLYDHLSPPFNRRTSH